MTLILACSNILRQLTDMLNQVRESDFVRPAATLSGATIGQHLRHTLEFFICLERGYGNGIVNYDKRAHDVLIETDKFAALSAIERVRIFIAQLVEKPLKLEVSYDVTGTSFACIDTTAVRELVYNIEHAVHHMALIKIGIREIAGYVGLDADFGIAASTVRHRLSLSVSS